MADKLDQMEKRLKKLESQFAQLSERPRESEYGTLSRPTNKVFLRDAKTGAVAEVDFDSVNDAVRVKKVR